MLGSHAEYELQPLQKKPQVWETFWKYAPFPMQHLHDIAKQSLVVLIWVNCHFLDWD